MAEISPSSPSRTKITVTLKRKSSPAAYLITSLYSFCKFEFFIQFVVSLCDRLFCNLISRLVYGVLAVIIITATFHDILKGNGFISGNSFAVQLLHCFSAKRNFASLFSTEDSKDSLSCVHGMRVLTTCFFVLVHVGVMFQVTRTIYNSQMLYKVIRFSFMLKI